jgi:hypothetical protein
MFSFSYRLFSVCLPFVFHVFYTTLDCQIAMTDPDIPETINVQAVSVRTIAWVANGYTVNADRFVAQQPHGKGSPAPDGNVS